MTIDDGTGIVLAYVLVSMGVIIAFLLAAFVIGWFIVGCASAADQSAEATDAEATDGMGTMRFGQIAGAKADQIRADWQDTGLARMWQNNANKLDLRARDAHLRRSRVNAIDASNDK